jgi:hypothetical protein
VGPWNKVGYGYFENAIFQTQHSLSVPFRIFPLDLGAMEPGLLSIWILPCARAGSRLRAVA